MNNLLNSEARYSEFVHRVCRYIERHLKESPTLADLSAHTGLSPYHLHRVFKRVMGITPKQYAEACRLRTLKEHLRNGSDVSSALYAAGYGSSSRLYERANREMGMTPATYRRGGQGMRISYTIINCPLGQLLIAATERGLCAVHFGSTRAECEALLRREYPAAEIIRDDRRLRYWVTALQNYFQGRDFAPQLSLDLHATAFQQRVWEALRKIPYGETRSYSEVARAIGQPKAARAVARACATNPVPIVIPCHRVIRNDGSLGGYGGGIARKKKLLQQEQKRSSKSGKRV